MKTDKLERFVIDHRDEFDDLEPNPAIWQNIETREVRTVQLNWTKVLVRVAAVAVIFVSSYIFIDYYLNKQASNIVVAEVEDQEPEDQMMYQDLREAEFYYASQIEARKKEVFCLAENDTPLLDEINIELVELDKVFQELKNDLKDNADNEEVVVAMIQNYRLKLEILEEIRNQLKSAHENTDCYENESVNM